MLLLPPSFPCLGTHITACCIVHRWWGWDTIPRDLPLLRKTDNSLEIPNVTLCQTESLESKQGGPQTKTYDILKAWVEEKDSVSLKLLKFECPKLIEKQTFNPLFFDFDKCCMNLGKLQSFDIIRLEIKYIFNNVDAHNLKKDTF